MKGVSNNQGVIYSGCNIIWVYLLPLVCLRVREGPSRQIPLPQRLSGDSEEWKGGSVEEGEGG